MPRIQQGPHLEEPDNRDRPPVVETYRVCTAIARYKLPDAARVVRYVRQGCLLLPSCCETAMYAAKLVSQPEPRHQLDGGGSRYTAARNIRRRVGQQGGVRLPAVLRAARHAGGAGVALGNSLVVRLQALQERLVDDLRSQILRSISMLGAGCQESGDTLSHQPGTSR